MRNHDTPGFCGGAGGEDNFEDVITADFFRFERGSRVMIQRVAQFFEKYGRRSSLNMFAGADKKLSVDLLKDF